MSSLVTLVLNNTDKIPIVGSSIHQVTTRYYLRNHQQDLVETPPPPYEKEPTHSRFSQISDYVWKRASMSTTMTTTVEEPLIEITLNKKQIGEGISLIQMATEMNSHGKNKEISIDLYMMGLDKILTSLPINSDPVLKSSLEKKLSEFKKRAGLLLAEDTKKKLTEKEKREALGGLSELIVQTSILIAVEIKKSPIPGIMAKCLQLTKYGLIKLDEICSIRERAANITHYGIAKAIEIDQHYEIHQIFAEVFYTACTAILKAGIAYAEHDQNENQERHKQVLQQESSAVIA
ncbi:uncharacterized protein BX663DRAFT_551338 [Cokeromyces recurvatus]|uniref:uncharacterized protein n=1 Tax=Cokeromyces recurvatus TaxID=90255 RepID=UPI00221F6D2A|nr:uncharacterized protein BX663DRAFT_551338 [Cokeromyces recurvatus]KAI7903649.1 hypothetical protein BX663DRAFT_551338 [Cokeromyces recurvatus]